MIFCRNGNTSCRATQFAALYPFMKVNDLQQYSLNGRVKTFKITKTLQKKFQNIFAKYQRSCTQRVSLPFPTMSVWAQTNNYLQEVDELASYPLNTFQYRTYKLTNHPVLFALAQKIFCVPASSAPVEYILNENRFNYQITSR